MLSVRGWFALSLYHWLRVAFGGASLLVFALCGAAVYVLSEVEHDVARVAGRVAGEASPTAELLHAANEVALKAAIYLRTRGEADRKAVEVEFGRARRTFGQTRVTLAAREDGAETVALIRALQPELVAWRGRFDATAKLMLQSERSTRGLASHCSLLSTISLLLVTDDGTAVPGARAATHRATMQAALGALGEIQNSVLLASSLSDPVQLERAETQQIRSARDVAALIETTAASELRETLTDVAGRWSELRDELTNLKTTLAARNEAQAALAAAGLTVFARLNPVAQRVMTDTRTTAHDASEGLRLTVLVLGGAALLVPIGGWLVGRSIIRAIGRRLNPLAERLRSGAGRTAGHTGQVEADATALAASAEEQGEALRQLNQNANHVVAVVRENLRHIGEAERLTGTASECAARGSGSITGLHGAMREIASSSHRIQDTVGAIDELAFQTNLLSLNAAIEAARAGDAGRGFAVVAEEVRRLALRSAAAARETAEVVSAAQAKSARGIEAAEAVSRDFTTISDEVARIRALLRETAVASKRQAAEIEAMSVALRQLDEGTANSREHAARSAALVAELREHAATLDGDAAELSRFLLASSREAGRIATAETQAQPLAA